MVHAALGITRISDLLQPAAQGLRLGLSHEFLERGDGWPALKAAYKLPFASAGGLDHGIAYDAISAGRVDLIDIYATDAKVGRYKLRVLADDLGFFPKYDAVLLMRRSVDAGFCRAGSCGSRSRSSRAAITWCRHDGNGTWDWDRTGAPRTAERGS